MFLILKTKIDIIKVHAWPFALFNQNIFYFYPSILKENSLHSLGMLICFGSKADRHQHAPHTHTHTQLVTVISLVVEIPHFTLSQLDYILKTVPLLRNTQSSSIRNRFMYKQHANPMYQTSNQIFVLIWWSLSVYQSKQAFESPV